MNEMVYVSLPLLTAFIGWLTNKVAIKMLFRPRRPVRILGFTWQGLIPRRQLEVAEKISEVIEREFFSHHLILKEIDNVNLDPYLREMASRLINERIGPRLKGLPLLGGFINDGILSQLESMVADEIALEAQPLLSKLGSEIEQRIHVKKLVEERIAGFDLDKLEDVVNQIASTEFRNIEIMGGVLGFIVGIVQLLLLYLTGSLAG